MRLAPETQRTHPVRMTYPITLIPSTTAREIQSTTLPRAQSYCLKCCNAKCNEDHTPSINDLMRMVRTHSRHLRNGLKKTKSGAKRSHSYTTSELNGHPAFSVDTQETLLATQPLCTDSGKTLTIIGLVALQALGVCGWAWSHNFLANGQTDNAQLPYDQSEDN